ncbi:malonyl CoA-acyl carrier protein transacylase [Pseudoalteromonas luteoviolacea]|uniref:[acyl-carrier-protein] S-malonyltransferase n=1 Tax=Pseudoalteromonas luteoviolacea TaxID=43657 RepID=A0A1C0TW30_9GAMM|nr:ACP S-malonyltransferase [Pseudoalteromonas luteoviolacea]OCQ23542.1 malonyl CoA-acyl carrier protein transacylase [Pseudoalteromonas luteoviolacea]
MKTYIFPGQGSQYVGMGKKLFVEFTQHVELANDILGYSVTELCLADPKKQLNNTLFTQPALYVVSALAYLQQQKHDASPVDYFAGHSLGEYTALFAAGAMSFETGLKLVKKRGELMSQAASGAMAAVLNVDELNLRTCLQAHNLVGIDIANLNSPEQIVISGLVDDINRSQHSIEQLGGRFIKLNTSGAFHSRYMAPAQQEFAQYIADFDFSSLQTPVIANVTAKPVTEKEIAHCLIEQLTQPVRWTQSIEFLLAQGEMAFEELGPKKVLTKLVDSITSHRDATLHIGAHKPTDTAQTSLTPQQQIDTWNTTYPIGTEVKLNKTGKICSTRAQATLSFGHRPTIYLHDYGGYFHLSELSPLPQVVRKTTEA